MPGLRSLLQPQHVYGSYDPDPDTESGFALGSLTLTFIRPDLSVGSF